MANPPKAAEQRTLTRRRMLELGATGLGAAGLAVFVAPEASADASVDQAPGPARVSSLQNRRRRGHRRPRGCVHRRLDRAVDLAAVRLAWSAAGAESSSAIRVRRARSRRAIASRRSTASMASSPGPTIRDARRRAPSRDRAQSSAAESWPGAERARARSIRAAGPSWSARRSAPSPRPKASTARIHRRRRRWCSSTFTRSAGRHAGDDDRHELPVGAGQSAARIAHDESAHARSAHRSQGSMPTALSATTRTRAYCRAQTARGGGSQTDAGCRTLDANERVGEAHYEHPLAVPATEAGGRAGVPHPPGTHWYHPHAHGATHDQVASGLAGFLIVEGDVDDAINRRLTGSDRPDPCEKTGPYDYRERLMLLQRVEVFSADVDRTRRTQIRIAPPRRRQRRFTPTMMVMRPGAVERWRVLNASVDGRGFKHFMVLEGQFVFHDRQLWRVLPGTAEAPAAACRAGIASGRREGDAAVVSARVRRHHARRGRGRQGAAHDQRPRPAERRHGESARSAAAGRRDPRRERC